MIMCGNCKGKHASADEVRDCYKGKGSSDPAFVTNPATSPQLDFIKDLDSERDVDKLAGDANDIWMDWVDGKAMSQAEASRLIVALQACPTKNRARGRGAWQEVPEGRYGLRKEEDGEVYFIQVDKPSDGKWQGYVFANLITGAPGHWRQVRQGRAVSEMFLHQIAADVVGAASLFGEKTRSCGRCASPLSNVRSRAAGFGEICANKMGWPYPTREEALAMLKERGVDPKEVEQLELAVSVEAKRPSTITNRELRRQFRSECE